MDLGTAGPARPVRKFSRCFIALRRRALYHSRPFATTIFPSGLTMAVTIQNAEEQRLMREAGRLAAEVLVMIEPFVQAGVTTDELDQRCHEHIVGRQKAVPAPLH